MVFFWQVTTCICSTEKSRSTFCKICSTEERKSRVWIMDMMLSYISIQFLANLLGQWNSKACSPPSLTHWYWQTMGCITALAFIRHALVRKVSDWRLGEKRTNWTLAVWISSGFYGWIPRGPLNISLFKSPSYPHTASVNFISERMEMTNKAGSN